VVPAGAGADRGAVLFGFSGVIHPILGLVGLILLVFWLMSLIFALVSRLRRPKEPRQ